MPTDPAPEHAHAYLPNGLVRKAAVSYSPVSRLDHLLYDKVFSVGLCECGDIKKTHVANENQRTVLEEERRHSR